MNNNNNETSHDNIVSNEIKQRELSQVRNEQHQQRNKSWCDMMQKALPRCREMQENTHISTQYNHKKVANNVSNEIKQKRELWWVRNEQQQQRNKLRHDTMQKALPRCREMQEITHINTQHKHKKVANNVSNEIKQKRIVMSEKWTTTTKKQVMMWHNAESLTKITERRKEAHT